MFRKMLVVLAIAGLATTFTVAQTKYDGLSLSTLHIYTTQGVAAYNTAPIEMMNVSGTVLGTGWFYGYHGISVLPDEKHVIGADGLYNGYMFWHSAGGWVGNMNGGTGTNNGAPLNWWDDTYTGSDTYNGYEAGIPLVHNWAFANDWSAGNTAYVMSRGYWDGSLNIMRLGSDGTVAGGPYRDYGSPQVLIQAEVRLEGVHSNPYGYITVVGNNILGTTGYNDKAGVYTLAKNFTNHSNAISWLIDPTNPIYANTLIASSPNDWRGLGVDGSGNIYVEFKKAAGGFNIAKFDSAGNLLNDALVDLSALGLDPTDLKVADNTLFVSGSSKISLFSTSGALLSQISLAYTPNSIDLMGPVPEPSSIFGLFVGGSSLLALLRRKAR
jgi:hypothetical protein